MAIQADGPEGFTTEILEDGIENQDLLKQREIYWVDKFDALGPNGLNTAKPGNCGSNRGVTVKWEDETFRSINEAAHVLGKRLDLAPHVVERRLRSGKPLPIRARKRSDHPDAGSNLYRRWLALKKRHPGNIVPQWENDYDAFKSEVGPTFSKELRLIRVDDSKPWGPGNWKWASATEAVEAVHGGSISVHGVSYPSLAALANAYNIGVTTLRNRINIQGMSPDDAVDRQLGRTSYNKHGRKVYVDDKSFRSKRQAILYIAEKYNITEGQAKYRFEIGKFDDEIIT